MGWKAVRRTGVRRGQLRLIVRQLTIGGGIIGSFVVIGWILSALFPEQTSAVGGGSSAALAAAAFERGVARVGVYIGIVTLAAVLIATQLLAMTVKRRTVPDRGSRRN